MRVSRLSVPIGADMRTLLSTLSAALVGVSLSTTLSATPPEPAEHEFHFVVLGDAQFHSPALFNRIIDQTKRLDPAFVIQVGDLIDGYSNDLGMVRAEWQRFKHQLGPLGTTPYIVVTGHRDVRG